VAQAAFNKKILFTSKLDLNLRKNLVMCYIWSIATYGAETWTLWKADQKYLESFQMWCQRRLEISWTDCISTEEMLQIVKEEGNILQTIKRRKANWIGHMLHRNCLLKQVTEGKIRGKDGSYGKQRKKT